MFLYRVNEELSLELLQQHHRYELYDLIDTNRDHLRKWLQWVDIRQSPEDFEPIIKAWLQNYGRIMGLMQEFAIRANWLGWLPFTILIGRIVRQA